MQKRKGQREKGSEKNRRKGRGGKDRRETERGEGRREQEDRRSGPVRPGVCVVGPTP